MKDSRFANACEENQGDRSVAVKILRLGDEEMGLVERVKGCKSGGIGRLLGIVIVALFNEQVKEETGVMGR